MPPLRDGVLVPTGHLLAIRSDAGSHLDAAYLTLLNHTRDQRTEHAATTSLLVSAREELAAHLAELASVRTAGPRQGRRMGEAHLPDDQVQRRRAQEHQRLMSRLATKITLQRERIASLHRRQQELESLMESALLDALADGDRINGLAEVRTACYLKGAARSHPDPAALSRAAAIPEPADRPWLHMTSAMDLIASEGEAR